MQQTRTAEATASQVRIVTARRKGGRRRAIPRPGRGRDGAAAGDQEQGALQDRSGRKRDDQRMDAQQHDADAVDHADAGGDRQHGTDADQPKRIPARGDQRQQTAANVMPLAIDRSIPAAI